MIPRRIHYCWFGRGEKPKLAQKCIASWHKYCPDYEIIEWNEDNFDVSMNPYTEMCYAQKRYAFLTDYVRLLVVEEHGGIYFDTDVEVLKSFDDVIQNDAFFGFENRDYTNTGVGFGAKAHHSIVKQMLTEYENLLDGKHGTIGCPILNTRAMDRFGLVHDGRLQRLGDAVVYPAEWFNPRNSITGKVAITANTYSIHWYSMSWLPKKTRIRTYIARVIKRMFGENCLKWLKNLSFK